MSGESKFSVGCELNLTDEFGQTMKGVSSSENLETLDRFHFNELLKTVKGAMLAMGFHADLVNQHIIVSED